MFGFLTRSRSITKIALDPAPARADRSGLALVLIVKNEARHGPEWVRFHLAAGVRHIHVYDNGSTDGTVQALQAAGGDKLSVIPWDQKLRDGVRGLEIHNQVLAYAHAVRNFGPAYRWMSFLDVDEFLVPVRDASLPQALAGLDHAAQVSLPWHMFGRSGHVQPPAGGVLENYTRRNPDPMADDRGLRNFKMIVDPARVTALKVHTVWTDGSSDTWNDAGRRFTARARESRAFLSTERIQLNHYYTRSDAELRAKIARGPNLTTPDADHLRRVMRKVDNIERDEVEDRVALDYLARIGARP
jgi:hypothetical protein